MLIPCCPFSPPPNKPTLHWPIWVTHTVCCDASGVSHNPAFSQTYADLCHQQISPTCQWESWHLHTHSSRQQWPRQWISNEKGAGPPGNKYLTVGNFQKGVNHFNPFSGYPCLFSLSISLFPSAFPDTTTPRCKWLPGFLEDQPRWGKIKGQVTLCLSGSSDKVCYKISGCFWRKKWQNALLSKALGITDDLQRCMGAAWSRAVLFMSVQSPLPLLRGKAAQVSLGNMFLP